MSNSISHINSLLSSLFSLLVTSSHLVNREDIRSREIQTTQTKLISCKSTHTLGQVIKIVHFYRVHRIYIVGGEKENPIGVISLVDILNELLKEQNKNNNNKQINHTCLLFKTKWFVYRMQCYCQCCCYCCYPIPCYCSSEDSN